MKVNEVKRKLRAGGVSFGTMVFEFVSPGLPRVLAEAGAEFVIFDTEHSWFGHEQLGYLIASTKATGMAPLVRVANIDYPLMARPMDMGAMGLMIPRVETRAQVETVIRAMKYPPVGERGVGLGLAHDDYTGGDVHAKLRSANHESLVIIQVETALAIENLEAMLSVPGVDVAWVGHFDLSVSLGIPGNFEHSRFVDAIERVVAVCGQHGIAPGVMGGSVAMAQEWMARGFRAIAYSGDVWLLQNALREGLRQLRESVGHGG